MIIYVFSFLLMAGVLGYVALPLFRGVKEEEIADDEGTELQAQKTATYSAIKELEFDYELGNLSPADHQELEEKYKTKAAQILKELDYMKKEGPLDDIEKEIAQRRRGGRDSFEDDIERQVALRRSKVAPAAPVPCPQCGKPQKAEAKFCSSCGASMKLTCPACGQSYSAEDRFCSQCGAALKKEKKS